MEQVEKLRELFSETWVLGWIFAAVVGLLFWGFMIPEMRQNKRIAARITLVVLFGLLTAVEFCCFVQLLRVSPYSRYGFMASIMLPCLLFYGNLFIFVKGVKLAIERVLKGRRFNPILGFGVYINYMWCIPVAELSFAMAYSCTFGVVLSSFKAALTGIQYYIYCSFKKGTRSKKKKLCKEA